MMAVIALAGCSGAPGVTTSALALLLSWPLEPGRRMILAECDPDGSAVLHGLLQGTLGDRYGLRNLSVAARQGDLGDAFWRQLIDLGSDEGKQESPHDRLLLPGVTDPSQAASLSSVWKALGVIFRGIEVEHGHDVLIDLGRRGAFGPSGVLADQADAVFVVVRNTLRSVSCGRGAARAAGAGGGDLAVCAEGRPCAVRRCGAAASLHQVTTDEGGPDMQRAGGCAGCTAAGPPRSGRCAR
jgi:hypothetical protein